MIPHQSDKSNFRGETYKPMKEYHSSGVPPLGCSLIQKEHEKVVHEKEFESSPQRVSNEAMREYLESHIPEAGMTMYREDQEKRLLKLKAK